MQLTVKEALWGFFDKLNDRPPFKRRAVVQFVKEAPKGFFDSKLHDGWGTVSWEKVSPSVMRGFFLRLVFPEMTDFHLTATSADDAAL